MSAGDTKSEIAASRAIYFRDLDQGKASPISPSDPRAKRPSYVGISTALNGYTPYASYRTDSGRRISPPLHLPNQRQPHLNSVDLVLNQDGFQRSLAEFQETMRDITMGRPESSDITDNARILNVQDQFFPTSHMKEVITDGEDKSVTTITQFHSNTNGSGSPGYPAGSPGTPNSSQKKNLVSKQIERLYGGDPFAQIRLTSPEHQVRTHHADDILRSSSSPGYNGSNGTNGTAPGGKGGSPERSFGSGAGGFFAKRFGITKMKDHSTLKTQEHMPGEITPLKVPAVFKLLRPEFREQLKQSSCRVSMPDEEGKERVIPIQRELHSAPAAGRQSPQRLDTAATPTSRPATERIIPITRLNGNSSNGVNGVNLPPSRLSNGSSAAAGAKPMNGNAPVANGNGMYNGRQSSPLVNGNGLNTSQPIVNGVARRTVPNVIGFRNTIQSPPPPAAAKSSNEATVTVPAKPLIIRKLSPLSPKHILVAPSNGNHTAVKPAPAPKPEHLMSPPLSPVPSDGARSGSPADSCRTGSTMSPCPPMSTQDNFEDSGVDESSGPGSACNNLPTGITKLSMEDTKPVEVTNDQKVEVASDKNEDQVTSFMNSVVEDNQKDVEDQQPVQHREQEPVSHRDQQPVEHRYPEDYMEYNGDEEEMMDRDQYAPQYYGLRERELLCPILEEDNESTASGSLLNLQQASGSLQSLQQSPNIQQAAVAASEAAGNTTGEATTNGASTSGYSSDDPLLVTELQDGHYYIKVLENEIFKFEEQICDFDEELVMSTDIPEESREKILSTVGLAKLLMAQKLMQFRGLCDKNINVTVEEDPFVPTPGDLAGFWDMVHIQVEQVHNRFADLQTLRSQGWKEKKVEVKPKAKKPMNKNVNKPIKPKEKSEAAKARDEARKKMLEAKKKMMKLNKENKENSDLIIMM